MKGKIKNRLALLSILLIVGLLIAGMGTALGAGDLLKFSGKQVIASVTTNEDGMQVVTIREDGKVVKEVTLPEGSEGKPLTIKGSSDGTMVISQVSEEEIENKCNQPGYHCEFRNETEDSSNESLKCFVDGKETTDCPSPEQ
jgi:hypothetical protein